MKKLVLALWIVVGAGYAFAQQATNAIWVIGDGMGLSAVGLFLQGVRNTDLPQYPNRRATLEQFINQSVTGFYFANTYDTIVTDSSCAATQMATGALSRPGYIGLDYAGQPQETLLEKAYKEGKSIGVVTDVYVADATPAAFLTHTQHRKNKYDIARQLVDSKAQVVLGGGSRYFTQQENKKLLLRAKKKGWTVVHNATELDRVKKGRVLGLFADENIPFYGDIESHPNTPTLLQMTQKAVQLLSQNPKGFVLVVEAGKIDWALHDNEGGPALWEMINLDETLAYLWQWTQEKANTLLYLNADHETGVPSFEYRHLDTNAVQLKSAQGEVLYDKDTDYVNYPYYQRLFDHKHLLYYVFKDFQQLPKQQQTAERLAAMCDKALGYPTDLKLGGIVPTYDELIHKLNQAQGLTWSTQTHSSGMLMGIAYGPGAEAFSGVYHNTQIKDKFEKALGF